MPIFASGTLEGFIKSVHDLIWEPPIPGNPWLWAPIVYPVLILFVTIAVYLKMYSVRKLRHAVDVVRGKYDHPGDPGEVTHRQALFTALSGTVGLGNIAGVAVAVSVGGPGIVPWMILIGVLGMSVKLVECTLATKYRIINPDGTVSGGPMYYIQRVARFGAPLVVAYAIAMAFSALVGANLFQVHEAAASLKEGLGIPPFWTGIVFCALTAGVVLGGIKWIGRLAEVCVPFMGLSYLLMAIVAVAFFWDRVPAAVLEMLNGAFSGTTAIGSFKGAALGTTISWALNRALFSCEAGQGSAATAHAAAKTKEPVREGLVSMLEPFVDTVIICTLTGIVICVSGAWTGGASGVVLSQQSFSMVHPWLGLYCLPVIVVLLAYTTIIGWSYYGMQAVERLFGKRYGKTAVFVYKLIYIACTFLGAVWSLEAIVNLGNITVAVMLLINGFVLVLYLPEVRKDALEYEKKYLSEK